MSNITKSPKPAAEITAAPAKTLTISERFLADVERQFQAQLGEGVKFTALEKRLTQHMFLSVDQALRVAEDKRTENMPADKLALAAEDPRAFIWKNVNRQKLAIETVNAVSLGLDPLMPNHVHPLPFYNTRTGLYDLLLLKGFAGLDHIARHFASEPMLTIRYELVYATDDFRALPRSSEREIEGYSFEINSPFDRGEIVGGFGYVEYDDPRKNRLILVTQRDFERARKASKGGFWAKHDVEMHLKTIVRRVAGRLPLDASRVNPQALSDVFDDDDLDGGDSPVERVAVAAHNYGNSKVVDVERLVLDSERPPEPDPEVDPERASIDAQAESEAASASDDDAVPNPGF